MRDRLSLADARRLAPTGFRRWVLGLTGLTALSYALLAVVDAQQSGVAQAVVGRDAIMTVVVLAAMLIAARRDPLAGAAITILASWIEIETAFLTVTEFPSPSVVVLPILTIGIGLLFGRRIAFWATIVTIATTAVTHWFSPPMQATGVTSSSIYWLVLHAVAMLVGWSLLSLSVASFMHVFSAMLANEKDLADTIRFAPDGILVVDPQDRIVLANPMAETLLRRERAALVGAPLATVLHGAGPSLARIASGSRGDITVPVAVQLDAADGAPVHVEAAWRTMEGGRHQLLLRDVTARVRAEEQRQLMETQLAHSQRLDAVGRLAGGLSHDFNNILTAVSGSAEMLRFEKDPAERTALLDEIIAARDRGAALTRQLLAFARREVTQPRIIDVATHVRGLERLLERVAGDRQRLRLELAPDCRVRVDPAQFEQVLVNLVSNARDAMPDGGTCTIRVARVLDAQATSQIQLTVTDDGVGMSPDVAARAFEPFFTTKPRGQGTGLGLASVHGMAEQSDGTARLHSARGEGTCVTIELPAVDDAATLVSGAAELVPATGGGRSILVVEDDSGTRRIVERILRHAGYQVRTAGDGSEAIAILDAATTPFDLVLSDVMMPGCTGPEVAERVRDRFPGTPVLLMTGYAEEQLGTLVDGLAGRAVIAKPFSGSALTSRLATLLRDSAAIDSDAPSLV
ncbi:MAG: response regulator [Gemmatimonadaceae bacterium]|nr:response regulator [Gemmatimonadaceae bacterium]